MLRDKRSDRLLNLFWDGYDTALSSFVPNWIAFGILLIYTFVFHQNLMADLKSELSKNLERLVLALMMSPAEFDAKMMKKAIEVQRKKW